MILEVTQKRARPLGNDKQMKVNISGIIHSIILLCARCFGSAVDVITIFCCAHIVAPTRIASRKLGSARLNPRNLSLKGTIEYTMSHE